jgi:hypothetical protein
LEKCDRPPPPGSGEIGDATDAGAPEIPCWAMATKCLRRLSSVDRLKQPYSLVAAGSLYARRFAKGRGRLDAVYDGCRSIKLEIRVWGVPGRFCCLGWKDNNLATVPRRFLVLV